MTKHPYDKKVFFTQSSDEFLSYREVHGLMQSGSLPLHNLIFDTDGSVTTGESIARGLEPRWAMTAENDPVMFDCPPLSKENAALVDELLCEDDFLEMPSEPKSKSVRSYLASQPRIARLVTDAERWMIR